MPDTSSADLPLSSFLTYRITLLSQLVGRATARWHHRNSGLNLAEWRVMATLGFFGDMSPGDVSAQAMIDKAVVSRVKAALLKQDLIFDRPDGQDSRKRIMGLSEEGRRLYDQVLPKARERQAELMAQLSDEELATISACMDKLTHYLERQESIH